MYFSFQVRRARNLACFIFYLTMLTSPTFAYPRPRIVKEKGKSAVIFQNYPCERVSPEQLKARMGGDFDDSRMAHSREDIKRNVNAGGIRPLNEIVEEEDSLFDDDGSDELDSSIEEFLSSIGQKSPTPTVSVSQGMYMRRKRDLSGLRESVSVQKRRRFKSKSRIPQTKLPWTCDMKTEWVAMNRTQFPSFVFSGRCVKTRCFHNRYECIPKKYAIKILERDPNRCNPIPTYGVDTTYEELWYFKRIHVTVACECGGRRKGGRRRGRKLPGRL